MKIQSKTPSETAVEMREMVMPHHTNPQNTEWKIVDIDQTRLSEWEDKRSNITCPDDKTKNIPGVFEIGFCKTVWDEDSKKTVIVRMHQGCTL